MSDMTLGDALRAQERSRQRIAKMKAAMTPEAIRRREKREKEQQARREQDEALRAFWCQLGNHKTERHTYLQETFNNVTVCMACQFKIVENLEAVLELPAVTEAMMRAARFRKIEKKQAQIMRGMRKGDAQKGDGLVYYMRINGRIKIGYTTNLKQRSRNYPPGTELIAVEPGTRETEARRHNQFSRSLAQGREWFAESPALTELMTELAAEYGVPTELMYQHARHEGIKHV